MRVAVIGGGPAGASVALALKHHMPSCKPIIYESAAAIRNVGAGINLASNGQRSFNYFAPRALKRLMEKGYSLPYVAFLTHNGRAPLASFKENAKMVERFGFAPLGVKRCDLQNILLDECRESGCEVHLGKRLAAIRDIDSDRPILEFEDGTVVNDVDVVVGADGLQSKTRGILWDPKAPRYTGLAAFIGLFRIQDLPDPERFKLKYDRFTAMTLDHSGSQFGTYQITAAGDVLWFTGWKENEASETWGELSDREEQIERMILYLRERGWDLEGDNLYQDMMRATYRLLKIGVYDRDALPKWRRGRITLAGDAAHPIGPHIGQGAGLSIEDAGMLGLSLAHFPNDPIKGLEYYEEIRHKRTQEMLQYSRQMGQMNMFTGWQAKLRDLIFRAVFKVTGMSTDIIHAFDYQKVFTEHMAKSKR